MPRRLLSSRVGQRMEMLDCTSAFNNADLLVVQYKNADLLVLNKCRPTRTK